MQLYGVPHFGQTHVLVVLGIRDMSTSCMDLVCTFGNIDHELRTFGGIYGQWNILCGLPYMGTLRPGSRGYICFPRIYVINMCIYFPQPHV